MKLSRLIEDLSEALAIKGDVDVICADPSGIQHRMISVTFISGDSSPVTIETYTARSSSNNIEAEKHKRTLSGTYTAETYKPNSPPPPKK
ncbi:hypothetical protein EVC24_125 [Rhizobium phage RHph_I4]|nr:hypothetical protein EVC24_125 [Rhizobium phage RHph_I4]